MEFGTPVEEQKEVSPPKLKTSTHLTSKSSKSKENEEKKSKEKDEFSDSLTEEDLEGLDVPEHLPLALKLSSADLLSPPKKNVGKEEEDDEWNKPAPIESQTKDVEEQDWNDVVIPKDGLFKKKNKSSHSDHEEFEDISLPDNSKLELKTQKHVHEPDSDHSSNEDWEDENDFGTFHGKRKN